jgi:ribosomal protein L44E
MSLPILNDKPKYEVKVPSTGKKVKFRPYLVKEEKILLLAMESKDEKQILQALLDTVLACIQDEIDRKTITTFDIEYLFMKIRSKSVGERAPLIFKCKECGHENEHVIDVDKISINVDKKSNSVIKLTDDISLKMKWPTYLDMVDTEESADVFTMVEKCIYAVMTEEEQFILNDQPKEDVNNFLNSLTSEQYSKITEYVESIPQMKYDVNYTCTNCTHENHHELKGIQDFF